MQLHISREGESDAGTRPPFGNSARIVYPRDDAPRADTQCDQSIVPGSSFYATPGLGEKQVRFAFAKKLETLEAAAERLRQHAQP